MRGGRQWVLGSSSGLKISSELKNLIGRKVARFGPLCLSSDSTRCQESESLSDFQIRRAVPPDFQLPFWDPLFPALRGRRAVAACGCMELGARGRAARAPGRSAGCRGARRRGTYWHTHRHSTCASLPGCCSPPAPVAAQVASRRAFRQRPRGASGPRRHRVLVLRVGACVLTRQFDRTVNALWRRVPPMNVPPKL